VRGRKDPRGERTRGRGGSTASGTRPHPGDAAHLRTPRARYSAASRGCRPTRSAIRTEIRGIPGMPANSVRNQGHPGIAVIPTWTCPTFSRGSSPSARLSFNDLRGYPPSGHATRPRAGRLARTRGSGLASRGRELGARASALAKPSRLGAPNSELGFRPQAPGSRLPPSGSRFPASDSRPRPPLSDEAT
jgi:hypothetical protein